MTRAALLVLSLLLVTCAYSRSYGAIVVQVAAGRSYTAVVKSDGTVWAWGDNTYGQLGDGTTMQRCHPVQVSGLAGVTAVAAGSQHMVALEKDGSVWAWGYNEFYGQLGDGSTVDRSTPVQVSGLSRVTAIAAGCVSTLALKDDGTVWAWGYINHHVLPTQVAGPSGIVAIAAGAFHAVALDRDGRVWAWGDNHYGQLGDGSTIDRPTPVQVSGLSGVTAIAAGQYQTAALMRDGKIKTWGWNFEGQLGNGTTDDSHVPVDVAGLSGVVDIAMGGYQGLALRNDGTVWGWGDGCSGQLGNGWAWSSTAVRIAGVSDVKAIAAGESHCVALNNSGTVWTWGDNASGELGNGAAFQQTTPIRVSRLPKIAVIAAGGHHAAGLTVDGDVWTWGSNLEGQLGAGPFGGVSTPVVVSTLSEVTAIAAGDRHTAAVRKDGTVWTWGEMWQYQLVPLGVPGASQIVSVAAGGYSTVALSTDGAVRAWGGNQYGQLGDGSANDSTLPVRVAGVSGVTAVAAGFLHTVMLKYDGTVWACGANDRGQLGDGTTTQRTTPVQVPGLSGVIAIAAGSRHTVALKQEGTVWAWGDDSAGQLGDGTIGFDNYKPTPVQVTGLSEVAAVSAGERFTVAARIDGTVWAWGDNMFGQLGDGSTDSQRQPVKVLGLSGVTAVAAGEDYALALTSDGAVFTWGKDEQGELGDGYSYSNPIPGIVPYLGPAPSGSVAINNGASYSTTQAVTLSLLATDDSGSVPQMRISNDGVFDTEPWEEYRETKSWMLTSTAGQKTVSVQFRDASGNESETATAAIALVTPLTTGAAKQAAAGSWVVLTGQAITAILADSIYIESPDRTAGIRVSPMPNGIDLGYVVDVAGFLNVVDGEVVLSTVGHRLTGFRPVQPLAISINSLGGGAFGNQWGTAGWRLQKDSVTGNRERRWGAKTGLNNIGLLVKTWGEVAEIESVTASELPTWFKIDDGSGTNAKVMIPFGGTAPSINTYVTVTGISSCERSGSDLLPVLRVNQQSGIEL